jgi:hypothetical protein
MISSTKILENLKERKFELERYPYYAIDEEENVLTLLSWTVTGKISGYCQYRPDKGKDRKNDEGRGRYYVRVGQGFDSIWGMETYHYRDDILCLTEGLFDAAPLHNRGIPTLAVFTSNPKPLKSWLYTIPRKIIAIRDNDSASKLQNFADYSFTPVSKDLGDASDDEVDELVGKILKL